MRCNQTMKLLLKEQDIDPVLVAPVNQYPIWQKRDRVGRPYWGVSHFWSMDSAGVDGERKLAQLEWDGNEVYLDAHTSAEIPKILQNAIGILKSWKRTLEQDYPAIPFLMLATFDNGKELVNSGDYPEGFFSITFRFWAPRNDEPVLNLERFDDWEQPAIVVCCNTPDDLSEKERHYF